MELLRKYLKVLAINCFHKKSVLEVRLGSECTFVYNPGHFRYLQSFSTGLIL